MKASKPLCRVQWRTKKKQRVGSQAKKRLVPSENLGIDCSDTGIPENPKNKALYGIRLELATGRFIGLFTLQWRKEEKMS